MNANKLVQGIVIFFLVVGGLVVVMNVLTSGGNALGQLGKYITIIGLLCGIILPRLMFFFMIIATAYLDLYKRFLVLDYRISQIDLYYVLGFSSLTLLGISIGVVMRLAVSGKLTEGRYIRLILISVAAFVVMAIPELLQYGFNMAGASQVANSAAYAVLIFVVPVLFSDMGELVRLLKIAVWIFLPVAAYSIYQYFFGLTNFEHEYLISGFTSEIRALSEKNYARVNFSTLNSAHAVSVMCAIMALLAAVKINRRDKINRFEPVTWSWIAVPLFIVAAILTRTRAGWFTGIVAVIAYFAFKSRFGTLLFYGGIAVGFTSLFVFVDFWDEMFKTNFGLDFVGLDSEVSAALSTGNWRARLYGMKTMLGQPDMLQPFGVYAAGGVFVKDDWLTHDLFTQTVIIVGYVPVILLTGVVIYVLVRLHSSYLDKPESIERKLMILSLAIAVGILAGGITNQSALRVYPVNFYLWFMISIGLVAFIRLGQKVEKVEQVASTNSPYMERPRGAALES